MSLREAKEMRSTRSARTRKEEDKGSVSRAMTHGGQVQGVWQVAAFLLSPVSAPPWRLHSTVAPSFRLSARSVVAFYGRAARSSRLPKSVSEARARANRDDDEGYLSDIFCRISSNRKNERSGIRGVGSQLISAAAESLIPFRVGQSQK